MIKKCVFPAAGYGTRFLPATKSMPKEMLPIMHRPLIEYGVEEALNAGMRDICIVTGRGKRAIEDYFDVNYELETEVKGTTKEQLLIPTRHIINKCTFSYIRQKHIMGLGDAILTAKPIIGNNPFGVILADDLCIGYCSSLMQDMIELYKKHQCSIVAVIEVPDQHIHRYGVVSGNHLENIIEVDKLIEKPNIKDKPSNWAIIGRYILTPDIFEIIENTATGFSGEVQITDAISQQILSKKVIAYKFNGLRFDCGSVDGFVAATNYLYNKTKVNPKVTTECT